MIRLRRAKKKSLRPACKSIFAALALLFCVQGARAQYEIPNEIFQRTVVIRYGREQATAFRFDQGGRIYLVTTRHFGKILPHDNARVQFWHQQIWHDAQTLRTLFPADKNVDLALLETDEQIERPYAVLKSSEVLTAGQEVWFMGWPFRLPNLPASLPAPILDVPIVNLGKISAIDPARPDLFEIHFQGSTSAGFGGGPIIYWSPTHQDYEILGVVKRDESKTTGPPSEQIPPRKTRVVTGYSIDYVVEAITQSSHP